MIIQYLKNVNNNMYYKAVDNKELFMWSPRANKWVKPCTTYSDLFKNGYLDNFNFINEKQAAELFQ